MATRAVRCGLGLAARGWADGEWFDRSLLSASPSGLTSSWFPLAPRSASPPCSDCNGNSAQPAVRCLVQRVVLPAMIGVGPSAKEELVSVAVPSVCPQCQGGEAQRAFMLRIRDRKRSPF